MQSCLSEIRNISITSKIGLGTEELRSAGVFT